MATESDAPGIRVASMDAATRFGVSRVIEPAGALPQNARRIDNTPVARAGELLCAVDWLNIDSASFRQIDEACDGDTERIAAHITQTVRERGKQHNAVTGSGGMFVGRIVAHGAGRDDAPAPGTAIASLVSLTLTPLVLDEILAVDRKRGRLQVRGSAILCASASFATLPHDLPVAAALALFDVAGAPLQTARRVRPGMNVLVVGADGKSGLLACAAARAAGGRVTALVPGAGSPGAALLHSAGLAERVVTADARDALGSYAVYAAVVPDLADLTVNCVNVAGTELASLLCTRDRGTVFFFSMATSFSAAALGAEGMGKDVDMFIGNGFAQGHAEFALAVLRHEPALLNYFVAQYGGTDA